MSGVILRMIFHKGKPDSKIWLAIYEPTASDFAAGSILATSVGWELSKWNLPPETYYTCITDGCGGTQDHFLSEAKKYEPAIIITLGDKALNTLCPQTIQKNSKTMSLTKWAGSLLVSPLFTHKHYVSGTYHPEYLFSNWKERDIAVSIDIGRAVEEYTFFLKNNILQKLPSRILHTGPSFDDLMYILYKWQSEAEYLSTDIETIRTKKNSIIFNHHPGLIYLIGLAISPWEAVSFCPHGYDTTHTVSLYKLLDRIFQTIPQIGQNYFNFDAKFIQAEGFTLCLDKCRDTYMRHQLLWPSLPHSLQFMTRQYTREPYYKDEGKGFSPRSRLSLERFMKYNGLDCCVTYEIYNEQEKELAERNLL